MTTHLFLEYARIVTGLSGSLLLFQEVRNAQKNEALILSFEAQKQAFQLAQSEELSAYEKYFEDESPVLSEMRSKLIAFNSDGDAEYNKMTQKEYTILYTDDDIKEDYMHMRSLEFARMDKAAYTFRKNKDDFFKIFKDFPDTQAWVSEKMLALRKKLLSLGAALIVISFCIDAYIRYLE